MEAHLSGMLAPITSITWAGPRCEQELATILAPQNRIQGRCEHQVPRIANELTHHSTFFVL